MTLPDFPKHTDLICKYGEAFLRCGKESRKINVCFFAALFLQKYHVRYFGNLKTFLEFENENWIELPAEELMNKIEKMILDVALENDVPFTGLITNGILMEIQKTLLRKAFIPDFPKLDENVIPCANMFLMWDSETGDFVTREYTVDAFIRNKFSVAFDPAAQALGFLAILEENIPDPEDRRILQEMLGAALFSCNRSRKILILYGEGSTGKSFIVNILRSIMTNDRCFAFDLASAARDYEFAALTTESLLIANETAAEASGSDGAETLKALVGGDSIRRKRHGSNKKADLEGFFSVVVMSNHRMQFPYDGRGTEWRSRIVPVEFTKPVTPDYGLVSRLMKEESSGILNWFLEGARRVRRNGWTITLSTEQQARCEELMVDKNPVEKFVRSYIRISAGHNLTSQEILDFYNSVQGRHHWPSLAEKTFFHQLNSVMGNLHNNPGTKIRNGEGREVRGYHGVSIVIPRARGVI